MKWRCPQCGRPHAANDPPCGDCGHARFERAVVPAGVESDGPTFQWVCPDCGKAQPKNAPPCSRCGCMSFERRSVDYVEEAPDSGLAGSFDGLLPVAGVAIVVIVGFALLALGVVSLPGGAPPRVHDAPGQADAAAGIEFDAVEREVLARFDGVRADAGKPPVRSDETFEAVAAFSNRRTVAEAYDGGRVEGSLDAFDWSCSGPLTLYTVTPSTERGGVVGDYDSPGQLAAVVAANYRRTPQAREALLDAEGRVGVDVHAGPDGAVYVTTVLC